VIATQHTIAEALGISIATVSRALRNDSRISTGTKERVQKAAAELGYRPNPMVSALMERVRSSRQLDFQGKIAVIDNDDERLNWHRDHPTHTRTYKGLKRAAADSGYTLEEFSLRDFDLKGHRLSQILAARGIQGLFIAPHDRLAEISLDWERFSPVTSGYSLIQPDVHRVCFAIYSAIKIVCRKLEARGYRRIGFHLHESRDRVTDHRYRAGFLLFQDLLPFERRVDICITKVNDKSTFHRWLERERPDSVVSGHPHLIDWINDAGLKCPDDIGYVDMDWVPEKNGITGIFHNPELIGAAVADIIIALINRNERGIPPSPRRTLIMGEWVDGSTIRSARSIQAASLPTL